MTKKINTLLMSVVAILLCVMLMVTGTYALFSEEVEVYNHLQAGVLDVTLWRATVTTTKLDEHGDLVTDDTAYKQDVDLSNTDSSTVNALGFEADEKIVPGVKSEATFVVENFSDVAFGYWIEIVVTKAVDKDGNVYTQEDATKIALAQMLDISVTTNVSVGKVDGPDGYELTAEGTSVPGAETTLAEGLVVKGKDSDYIAGVGIKEYSAFTVNVSFRDIDHTILGDDDPENNDAMSQQIFFDLVVHAVQLTAPLA